MKALFYAPWAAGVLWGIAFFAVQPSQSSAQTVTPQAAANDIRIESMEGRVEVNPGGNTQWVPALPGRALKAGDRVRTRERSSVAIRWSDQSRVRLPELSDVRIQASTATQRTSFSLITGLLYFFNRERLTNARYGTQTASAAIRGTEFVLQAEENRTTLTVIEGEVELSNEVEPALTLRTGEQGVAELGQAPRKTPAIIVNNVIQWALYYPAVLDVDELGLTLAERNRLATSLTAYKSGELLRALDLLPAAAAAESSGEKIYRAGLLLAVGNVAEAEQVLSTVAQTAGAATAAPRSLRLADALRTLIAAVKLQPSNTNSSPELASEWLAESYSHQSRGDLRNALQAARRSVEVSADFGFGWTRVAELEFSFGHTSQAHEALERGLLYSPRNAQALALKGFVLAAQNRISEAISWFNRAITVDANLGNAWLGRGLCLIRQNHSQRGREDLLTAVAMEPQRAILRSYLGKAYTDAGDDKRATHELQIAKDLDPNDPTAWFYSALLDRQENEVNRGIRDLEKSKELNKNRYIYRSEFLLDQDQAVRSVNLARLYADADLGDFAVYEAGRAVTLDYADYSAHAFLANSYEVERRANLSNLRFEAASFNEYLLANLLGPANGRLLAQPVTQLEYSSLFERNRLGLIANTEYFSRGAWYNSSAQYGTYNGSSYSLEAEYRSEPGERVNQDLEIRQLEGKFKYDLTPDDSLYFHVIDFRAEGGDIGQHFDESEVSSTFRFDQKQAPTVLAGYHHQWSPQNHTLLFAGRFDDTLDWTQTPSSVYVLDRFLGTITGLVPVGVETAYRNRSEVYVAEVQQIVTVGSHSLIGGARMQLSKQGVNYRVEHWPFDVFDPLLGPFNPIIVQNEDVWSSSASVYAYDSFRLTDYLQIIGGLNFTHQSVPVNTGTAPISTEHDHQERLGPKAGIIWSPLTNSTLRASYTKSLAGSGLGQSVRLEPTQVAGLLQAFRAQAPISLVGDLEGADIETGELVWESRLDRTYLALGGQWREVERQRRLGLFLSSTELFYNSAPVPGLIREHVQFNEYALDASVHRLVSEEWSFGVQYRLAYAQLERSFPDYLALGPPPAEGGLDKQTDWRGWLHTVRLTGLYRHRSGLFARAEGVLFAQDREQDDISLRGDDFWQVNLIAGYRFPRQRAEIAIGLLNVLDNDYRLDPINSYAEQPRSRTLYARLFLNF